MCIMIKARISNYYIYMTLWDGILYPCHNFTKPNLRWSYDMFGWYMVADGIIHETADVMTYP